MSDPPIVALNQVTKTYQMGDTVLMRFMKWIFEVHREICRHHGSVGMRQVNATQFAGLPRQTLFRKLFVGRHGRVHL